MLPCLHPRASALLAFLSARLSVSHVLVESALPRFNRADRAPPALLERQGDAHAAAVRAHDSVGEKRPGGRAPPSNLDQRCAFGVECRKNVAGRIVNSSHIFNDQLVAPLLAAVFL